MCKAIFEQHIIWPTIEQHEKEENERYKNDPGKFFRDYFQGEPMVEKRFDDKRIQMKIDNPELRLLAFPRGRKSF